MAKPTKSEISAKAIEGAPKALVDAYRGASLITASALQKIIKVGKEEDVADFAYLLDKPLSTEEVELMLSNQAILLNAMGHRQAKLSFDCMDLGAKPESVERFMKNGYKALELSRKCLTALNEVRNPRRSATFIKQQNNQLNLNGEHDGSAKMDRIAESKTESFNPNMATLEPEYRLEDDRGQS